MESNSRKRGRPRKLSPSIIQNEEKKKRGRPRKVVDQPSTESPITISKKRGRPRKVQNQTCVLECENQIPSGKKRGRPRKERFELIDNPTTIAKKRGRPRKDRTGIDLNTSLFPKKCRIPAKEYEDVIDVLFKERDILKEEVNNTLKTIEVFQNQLDSETHSKAAVIAQLEMLKRQNEESKKANAAVEELPDYPESAEDVLNTIASKYPNRLTILPDAVKSARSYTKNNIKGIWKLFKLFPTTLYTLLFESNLNSMQISTEFRNSTNFDLTFTEGPNTKKDSKLMQRRIVSYNGQQLDITPHAKVNNSNGQFRIHFYVDHANKKIVIGYFGEHLPTFSNKN